MELDGILTSSNKMLHKWSNVMYLDILRECSSRILSTANIILFTMPTMLWIKMNKIFNITSY